MLSKVIWSSMEYEAETEKEKKNQSKKPEI